MDCRPFRARAFTLPTYVIIRMCAPRSARVWKDRWACVYVCDAWHVLIVPALRSQPFLCAFPSPAGVWPAAAPTDCTRWTIVADIRRGLHTHDETPRRRCFRRKDIVLAEQTPIIYNIFYMSWKKYIYTQILISDVPQCSTMSAWALAWLITVPGQSMTDAYCIFATCLTVRQVPSRM